MHPSEFPVPRRTLLGMMAGGLIAAPLANRGQEAREATIGLLTERSLSVPHIEALRRGLTELGWVEGRNPIHPKIFTAVQREGARLDLELQEIGVRASTKVDAVFKAMRGQRFDAFFVPGDAMLSRECESLVELATKFRVRWYTATGCSPTPAA